MDQIDMELQEMLKETEGQAKYGHTDPRIIEFLDQHRVSEDIALKDAVGIDMVLFAADISVKGTFTLYTDTATVHGSIRDYDVDMLLHKILSEVVKSKGQLLYNMKTGYFYMFPAGIPFKVVIRGRIFQRYDFEV